MRLHRLAQGLSSAQHGRVASSSSETERIVNAVCMFPLGDYGAEKLYDSKSRVDMKATIANRPHHPGSKVQHMRKAEMEWAM